MSRKNILIVEDESIVAMELKLYLTQLNYHIVGICSTGDEAYQMIQEVNIDLVLMDIYLFNSDGVDTSFQIKKVKPNIPIIFLTAYIDEETMDRALSVNPIAYLVKPFNRRELWASIKIALKNISEDISLDNEFTFNRNASQLTCCGKVVHLSKKEKMLFNLFLNNSGRLISSLMIEYEIWPDQSSSDTRLRTLISRLRAKLKHRFIETCSAEGYIFRL